MRRKIFTYLLLASVVFFIYSNLSFSTRTIFPSRIFASTDEISEAEEAIKITEGQITFSRSNAEKLEIANSKIAKFSIPEKINDLALNDYKTNIVEIVKDNVGSITILEENKSKLSESKIKLQSLKDKLEAARNNISGDLPVDERVKKEKALKEELLKVAEEIQKIDQTVEKIDSVSNMFKVNLNKIQILTKELSKAIEDCLETLKNLPSEFNSIDAGENEKFDRKLMSTLLSEMNKLADAKALNKKLRAYWQSLKSSLESANLVSSETSKEIDESLASTDKTYNSVGNNFLKWSNRLKTFAEEKTQRTATCDDVLKDPQTASAFAPQQAKVNQEIASNLLQIFDSLDSFSNQAAVDLPTGLDRDKFKNSITGLKSAAIALQIRASFLNECLAGDFRKFQADQVSLYYFSDVPRLMKILNPTTYEVGGISGFREKAEDLRRNLLKAEIELGDLQSEVSKYQSRLEELKEEKRQAETGVQSALQLLFKQDRRLDDLRRRPNKDEGAIARAEADRAALQRDSDSKEKRLAELNDEQNGLPAKIREAKSRLSEAQDRVRQKRNESLQLAVAESGAFAAARDNAPFYYSPALGASTDPARRVLMYAFGDSKTIFLRGTPADLGVVKRIIAIFDRPAPQARITMWQLELSSTSDIKGTKKFNEALTIIENELSNTRARIAASVSFLRDCINLEVNRVAAEAIRGESNSRGFSSNVTLNPPIRCNPDILLKARLHFYQEEVLLRYGFDIQNSLEFIKPDLWQSVLPDPAATTTLGEALIVLILADPNCRARVLYRFTNELEGHLNSLGLKDPPKNLINNRLKGFPDNQEQWFALGKRALGADIAPNKSLFSFDDVPQFPPHRRQSNNTLSPNLDVNLQLSSSQRELIRAFDKKINTNLTFKLEKLIKQLIPIQNNYFDLKKAQDDPKIINQQETILDNMGDEILLIVRELLKRNKKDILSNNYFDLLKRIELLISSAGFKDPKNSQDIQIDLLKLQSDPDPLRTANARVAAADQMLKEIISAFEDDLDRHFIQPMIERLRRDLVDEKGISVGLVQRTSVLATNRLQARVDARGTAQLPLGEQQDILQGIQQLAQLTLAGQTGGVLGVLGGLNALPRDEDSQREIYGISTNGMFQITPVFDPSGQALRFKLDQVFSTRITEPNGSTNPQLARIERHTINTEVQLSNLELREISRFNTNARLGLATQKKGGIPILKYIPIIDEVPLLGWFVRKRGKAAVTQQSIIFGQTTIYPTIGDIFDLVNNSNESADY